MSKGKEFNMVDVKTIDINAKEWFDKKNGNSYFAAKVTVNYGMKSERIFILPYEYGYGDYYIQAGHKKLIEENILPETRTILWRYCKDNSIILRTSKQERCLKRELKAMGGER